MHAEPAIRDLAEGEYLDGPYTYCDWQSVPADKLWVDYNGCTSVTAWWEAIGSMTLIAEVRVTGHIMSVGQDGITRTADDEVVYEIDQSGTASQSVTVYRVRIGCRRKGTNWSFADSNSANVAAGGIDSDEHRAEFQIWTEPQVTGIDGEIIWFQMPYVHTPAVIDLPEEFDGSVVTGAYKSSDMLGTLWVAVFDEDDYTCDALVDQNWDAYGVAPTAFLLPNVFCPGVSDDCILRIALWDWSEYLAVPITGHTMQTEVIATTLFWQEWVVGAEPTEISGGTGEYLRDEPLPFDGVTWEDLLECADEGEAENGEYHSTHSTHEVRKTTTVNGQPAVLLVRVEGYRFAVHDQDVFVQEPPPE